MPRRLIHAGLKRLGEIGLGFGEGEIEPRRQSFDISRLDGRAAPDTQTGRRIPVRPMS